MRFGPYSQPQTLVSISVCLSAHYTHTHTHTGVLHVPVEDFMHTCNQHARSLAHVFFYKDVSAQVRMCHFKPFTTHPHTQSLPIRPQSIRIIDYHQADTDSSSLPLSMSPPPPTYSPIIPILIASRLSFNFLYSLQIWELFYIHMRL